MQTESAVLATTPRLGHESPQAITVAGLRKSYGPVRAVRDVSFCVRHGEIVALLGPNRAGKTTTLEILEGFRARRRRRGRGRRRRGGPALPLGPTAGMSHRPGQGVSTTLPGMCWVDLAMKASRASASG
jgi:ABC-type polysaccharide/polyol phosphate transport system ATPase subunit